MSVTVKWRRDWPNELENTFVLDDRKSWKGKMIRGHDIAEIIADELWQRSKTILDAVEIIGPASYKGRYMLSVAYDPSFSAKRVDI